MADSQGFLSPTFPRSSRRPRALVELRRCLATGHRYFTLRVVSGMVLSIAVLVPVQSIVPSLVYGEEYEYDRAGRLIGVQYDNGLNLRYTYDRRGNLLSRAVVDATDSRPRFHRGDSNVDGAVDVSDGVYTLLWLFSERARPTCMDASDANDDGAVDISDAVFTFDFLFSDGVVPPPPGPPPSPCGQDSTSDTLDCSSYTIC